MTQAGVAAAAATAAETTQPAGLRRLCLLPGDPCLRNLGAASTEGARTPLLPDLSAPRALWCQARGGLALRPGPQMRAGREGLHAAPGA
ncbi:unnamed protein product [Rangifer tarandus platyrhynchus]|uniref:Uncharacterized protein n=3 Tax=Rangifer tarandus platyrhynchus TaxID=3082113 RepID=A0ABN8ZPY9_RANTA|nr:unnamed protein product [Rangifer tarandus platyrhynchus]CAI9709614.1 unnamed protein product [Rangifer tarandus platyrhynchus]